MKSEQSIISLHPLPFISLFSTSSSISQVAIMAVPNSSQPHLNPQSNTQSSSFDILSPVRRWLDGIPIKNAKIAELICNLIPQNCPFERDIVFFGYTLFHIPALCKINPLYDQAVGLRFRALSFLCNECVRMSKATPDNCSNCSRVRY
jgi:hypothetical protein